MDGKKDPKKEFVDIARLTSVGIALVMCTFIGYWTGNYIDHKSHTAPIFMVIFLIVGMGAGILNVFRTLSKNSD
jgi:F0F1-type ATP synthase assembly protein I